MSIFNLPAMRYFSRKLPRPGSCPFPLVAALVAALACAGARAGSLTVIPGDSNSSISVADVIEGDNETTLLYFSWPNLGDALSGADCPLNFYLLTLTPGLPATEPKAAAPGVCGNAMARAGLFRSGEVAILANDHLQRWAGGEQQQNLPLTGHAGREIAFRSDGGFVLKVMRGKRTPGREAGARYRVRSVDPGGGARWEAAIGESSVASAERMVWAGEDGGALLLMETLVPGSVVADTVSSLVPINRDGEQLRIPLTEAAEPFDFHSVKSPEDMQKLRQYQQEHPTEDLRSLAVRARPGGGFDVLFQRKGGKAGREGHFLWRLGPDGRPEAEHALGSLIADHGLDKSADFYVAGEQLVLLSRVTATQPGVQAGRSRYGQTAVSRIDLAPGGAVDTRLIPLDQRYLVAAINAGDEEIQNLPGLPGGDPVLLTRIGITPVAVALGVIGGRRTLRINEATDELLAWNEHFQAGQARAAKAQAREQRSVEREQYKRDMNAGMARSVGMSPEEFSQLSNRERKELLVRKGDLATLQARQQLAANPHLPPELRAQMEAALAQMPAGGAPPAAASAAVAQDPAPVAPGEDVVRLDSGLRGFLEFEQGDGQQTTLLIFDRRDGSELFRRDYADGVVYEYIDFSQYGLPLEQIGLVYRDAANSVLSEPRLVVTP